jgi:hypothetical protein
MVMLGGVIATGDVQWMTAGGGIICQEMPVRFLLVSGQPIGEPVAWYGPMLMNTQEKLRIAFEEYEKGTFIKRR